ncbi:MAG TPA: cob(I)yrinic acid a,c-diamide adenosyltransferase [Methylocella sp.]|nr:cob(I)yrinic acid a,c-diamide adenosyltransferase [Methylocella sp.]
MIVLNKIYTRTGDDGTTALGSGERRAKHDLRIEAYGSIDEVNSTVGLARVETSKDAECARLDAMLLCIQNDLFDLGADLCVPMNASADAKSLRIIQSQVERLERNIDELNSELAPVRSFILPGGSPASAALHLARTIARRAERALVALAATQGEVVGGPALKYINRLSDFLFVAARYANDKGSADILWVPGANR